MKLTPKQVNTICKGDQEIAGYFHMLLAVIDKQAKRIETLEKRVHELERQAFRSCSLQCTSACESVASSRSTTARSWSSRMAELLKESWQLARTSRCEQNPFAKEPI